MNVLQIPNRYLPNSKFFKSVEVLKIESLSIPVEKLKVRNLISKVRVERMWWMVGGVLCSASGGSGRPLNSDP